MKTLFIQIPCYNEAETLEITLSALPRKVKGFDSVKWLIINDGSTDQTVQVAQQNGVDYIINHVRNQGLARAFMTGIEACVHLGADVIVNTDADNQYNAEDIPLLVNPIIKRPGRDRRWGKTNRSSGAFFPTKKIPAEIWQLGGSNRE